MTTKNFSPFSRSAGFTLMELLIAVAIVAIISAIAMPAYTDYVKKGQMRAVQADLVALSLNFENAYQRTLSYPDVPEADRTTTKLKERFQSWSPSLAGLFDYSMTVSSTTAYTLKAEGVSGTLLAGCTLTLSHTNARVSSGCPVGDWL